MFTGLIERTARLLKREKHGDAGKLTVEVIGEPFSGLIKGESIAVNGTCLTLEQGMSGGPLVFHVMRETFSRTNLGTEPVGAVLNLERAMRADGRFGGHIVSGHIDTTGKILSLEGRDSDIELTVAIPKDFSEYFVEKGSIAVDGISLTLEYVDETIFRIGLIPTTLEETNLKFRETGDSVNLETDILGKYVMAALKKTGAGKSAITMSTLSDAGFL